MSEQGAQALVERVQNDADFRRKLEQAPTPEEKKKIVQAAGYDVGPDDLPALKKAAGVQVEISDEELENVAGGFSLRRELETLFMRKI